VHLARMKKSRGHAEGRVVCGEPGALRMLAVLSSTRDEIAPSRCQYVAAALARTARARHMEVERVSESSLICSRCGYFCNRTLSKDRVGHAVMKVRFATENGRCSRLVYGILQANVYHDS
jgi:hypothetical protein